MNRRHAVHNIAIALIASLLLAACGGGGAPAPTPTGPVITQFAADRPTYFVGEQARLTVTFANGTGRLEPDGQHVTSGQVITTAPLSISQRYVLTVTDGATSVSRNLDLAVNYRERMRAIATPFARAEHATSVLKDGRVLIFGGDSQETAFPASMYVFDPVTERFSSFGELSSGRLGFSSATLANGDILIAGGAIALSGAPRAEIINGATGAVRATLGNPIYSRLYAAATVLMDGRVLITGGIGGPSGAKAATVEIYDPVMGVFTLQAGSLLVGRSEHTALRIDEHRVLIYGGLTLDGSPAPPELYDPIASTSKLLMAPEVGGRMKHIVHTLPDGGVLIVGGEDFDGQPLTSVFRFDPALESFSAPMNLATPRTGLGLGRLSDGRVLIVGGAVSVSSGDVTDTSELITPPAQRRDGARLNIARQLHSVTPLGDGRLLIFGGVDTNRAVLKSAEIFE